ncbi:hypothetical protein C8J56DRAFT_1096737 [Mycena floridula]|nr:hypothetical protein C8J56DRAFT_1096737 [Mycena floridula]
MMKFSDRFVRFQFQPLIATPNWMDFLNRYQENDFPNLETLEFGIGDYCTSKNLDQSQNVCWGSEPSEPHALRLWRRFLSIQLDKTHDGESGQVEITVIHQLLPKCPNLKQAEISASNSRIRMKLSAPEVPDASPLQSPEIKGIVDPEDGRPEDNFDLWRNVFLASPTISIFEFSGGPVSPEFLQQLTCSPNNDHPLFPRLVQSDVPCEENSLAAMIMMVESRSLPNMAIARSTEVTIHAKQDGNSVPPFDPLIITRVKDLSDSGLNIRINRISHY